MAFMMKNLFKLFIFIFNKI